MRRRAGALLLAGAAIGGCAVQPPIESAGAPSAIAAAEAVIDAFYSFDRTRLSRAMAGAESSMPRVLFYQGWAQGGNYVVLERKPCRAISAEQVDCSIKVRDDLIQVLGTGYDVTDTFHMTFANGRLSSIRTSSDDPPQVRQALEWLGRERPQLLEGPCKGFFDGGPTPQDCARAVVAGFRDWLAIQPR
jgi:hypothetical protein